jgi:hypothetical protein
MLQLSQGRQVFSVSKLCPGVDTLFVGQGSRTVRPETAFYYIRTVETEMREASVMSEKYVTHAELKKV